MAISRVKTWTAETLTASDLNAEFDNIIDNTLFAVSPLTANLAAGGFIITGLGLGTVSVPSIGFTGDTNTGIYSTGADNVSLTAGGESVLSLGSQAIIDVIEDARTNTIDQALILRSTTSGNEANGIGTGMVFQAETDDDKPASAGMVAFAYTDVSTGSEDSEFAVHLVVGGVAMEEKYNFRSTAATGLTGIFTHAASADRTWTLPNETGTILLGGRTELNTETTGDTEAAVSNFNHRTTADSVTFGTAYSAAPDVFCGAGHNDGVDAFGVIDATTTTGFNLYGIRSGSGAVTAFDWLAIGT